MICEQDNCHEQAVYTVVNMGHWRPSFCAGHADDAQEEFRHHVEVAHEDAGYNLDTDPPPTVDPLEFKHVDQIADEEDKTRELVEQFNNTRDVDSFGREYMLGRKL